MSDLPSRSPLGPIGLTLSFLPWAVLLIEFLSPG